MSKHLWRIAATVPASTRSLLLRLFPPFYEAVYCDTITWAYKVPEEYPFNPDHQTCLVVGLARTEATEALVCLLGGAARRPDGKPVHITLSTRLGVERAQAGLIHPDLVRPCDPVSFKIRLQRFPLWKLPARQIRPSADDATCSG